MTDSTPPNETSPPKESGKGQGCLIGGLVTVAALIGGSIAAGAIVTAVPSDSGGLGAGVAVLIALLPIGLLIAAGVYWRKMPGFLLGFGLTIGILLALFTGCVAIIVAAGS